MKDRLTFWINILKKMMGVAFGVIGSLMVLFPLDSVTPDNFLHRLILLVIIVAVILVASIVLTKYQENKSSINLYAKEKTNIIFEYADIKTIMDNEKESTSPFTIVVPVNTSLEYLINRGTVKDNSIHKLWMDYFAGKLGKDIDMELLNSLKVKRQRVTDNGVGTIGDWFFITPEDVGVEGKIRFFLLESSELEERNGKPVIKDITREEYLKALQSILDAIPDVLDQKEKVYIPLIGAGNGNVGKGKDIMHIMKAMLRFNRQKLRQEIHVVINPEDRRTIPIYQLREMR